MTGSDGRIVTPTRPNKLQTKSFIQFANFHLTVSPVQKINERDWRRLKGKVSWVRRRKLWWLSVWNVSLTSCRTSAWVGWCSSAWYSRCCGGCTRWRAPGPPRCCWWGSPCCPPPPGPPDQPAGRGYQEKFSIYKLSVCLTHIVWGKGRRGSRGSRKGSNKGNWAKYLVHFIHWYTDVMFSNWPSNFLWPVKLIYF